MENYHKLECSLTYIQSSQNLLVHETYLCVIPIKIPTKNYFEKYNSENADLVCRCTRTCQFRGGSCSGLGGQKKAGRRIKL